MLPLPVAPTLQQHFGVCTQTPDPMPRCNLRFLQVLVTAAPVFVSTWLAACAPSAPQVAPDPAQLEAERAKRPNDPTVLRDLGSAYLQKGDYSRAREALSAGAALAPRDPEMRMLLGAAYEELGLLDSASIAYRAAEPLANSDQKKVLAGRQAALSKKHLAADARAALQREKDLTLAPPTTGTIAVMPFRYTGTNPDLKPLERGLAELLVADLGKEQRLKQQERERVQALVDEMQLTEQGRADPTTGARSGRLVGAGQIVQGVLSDRGDQLALDANVVDAKDASVDASASGANTLARLIDTEKQVVFGLLRGLNIQLSPAEQRSLSERPTADLQAFLAYSRGLLREDAGDFAGAAAAFGQAASRDPSFRAAASRQAAAQQAATSGPAATMAQTLGAAGGGGEGGEGASDQLRVAIETVVPSTFTTVLRRTELPPPSTRPQIPEAARTDGPGGAGQWGQVIIVIPRP